MLDTKIVDEIFRGAVFYEMKHLYLKALEEEKAILEKEVKKWELKSMDLLLKYNGTSQIYFDTRRVLNKIYLDKKLVEKKIAFLNDYIFIQKEKI